jgi:hypothetical protein
MISSLASLLWPIVTLVFVLIFRKDITNILARLRKGKLLGQELELEPTVEKFRISVKEAEQELVPITPVVSDELQRTQTENDVSKILDDIGQYPSIALIKLSVLLEKEVRVLFGSLGHLQSKGQLSAPRAIRWLSEQGMLPKHTIGSLQIFWDIRNKIVHGANPPSDSEIVKVVDIGLTLLNALRAIPHETNMVHHPGVTLFSDDQCKQKIDGVYGLILETRSPGGGIVLKRIFPTTRPSSYKKGKVVTWEWDLSKVWGKAWYIDPDSNEQKTAWGSAGEFVGRHTDEI